MTLKIIHLADIHLGYRRFNKLSKLGFNQREVDVNTAFREAVDRAIQCNPSIVIIAGDIFHSVRPSNAVLGFAFREVRRLSERTRAPIVLIAGNHESPRRADTGCILKLFSEIPNVFVADLKKEWFVFDKLDLSVCAIPHRGLNEIKEISPRPSEESKYNILVTHGQFTSTKETDYGGVSMPLNSLNPHQWDYVALGHMHRYEMLHLNAYYSGSIEHTGTDIWVDATERKGFIEFELPTGKCIFHKLDTPREVISLPRIDAEGLEAEDVMRLIRSSVGEVAGGLIGKIVRLPVHNISREVLKLLPHKELKSIKAEAFHFSLEFQIKTNLRTETQLRYDNKKQSLRSEIKNFCIEKDFHPFGSEDIYSTIDRFLLKLEGTDETSPS